MRAQCHCAVRSDNRQPCQPHTWIACRLQSALADTHHRSARRHGRARGARVGVAVAALALVQPGPEIDHDPHRRASVFVQHGPPDRGLARRGRGAAATGARDDRHLGSEVRRRGSRQDGAGLGLDSVRGALRGRSPGNRGPRGWPRGLGKHLAQHGIASCLVELTLAGDDPRRGRRQPDATYGRCALIAAFGRDPTLLTSSAARALRPERTLPPCRYCRSPCLRLRGTP